MHWFKSLWAGGTEVARERRHSYRVKFSIEAVLIVPPTAAVPCQVLDLSTCGLRVSVAHPLRRGATVKLLLQGAPSGDPSKDTLEVEARVAWANPGVGRSCQAGLEFRGDRTGIVRDIADFLRDHNLGEVPTDLTQRRRSLRLEGELPLRFRVANGDYHHSTTRDVSATGVRFTSPHAIDLASQVECWLSLEDRPDPVLFIGDVLRCEPGPEATHDVTVQVAHVVA